MPPTWPYNGITYPGYGPIRRLASEHESQGEAPSIAENWINNNYKTSASTWHLPIHIDSHCITACTKLSWNSSLCLQIPLAPNKIRHASKSLHTIFLGTSRQIQMPCRERSGALVRLDCSSVFRSNVGASRCKRLSHRTGPMLFLNLRRH